MIKNYKKCVYRDTSRCVLFSACEDCYYYKECKEKIKKPITKRKKDA
jgi:hypothetical protein